MSALGVGCVKTPTLAARVETSRRNCVPESQIILHTRGVMPSWRIVFSTVRDCMSFYTARVIFVGSARSRRSRDVRFTPESGHRATQWACPLSAKSGLRHRSKEHPYSITSSAGSTNLRLQDGSFPDYLVSSNHNCRALL